MEQFLKQKNKKTGEICAVKNIKKEKEKEGFPITAIREINILKSLNHENIVNLKQIISHKDKESFYMIFEYVEHDLAGLIDANITLTEGEIKSLIQQILKAMWYLHTGPQGRKSIIHRDIKASNVLITKEGVVKLADFGLSRYLPKKTNETILLTNKVITRWYRPPELFLGSTNYGPEIDMWSVGCVMAELLLGRPIFPGETEVDQLELIFSIAGSPTKENWPDIENYKNWSTFKPKQAYPNILNEKFKKHSPLAVELLKKLLTLDPKQRINVEEALNDIWFWKIPFPSKPSNLPIYTCNELSARNRRKGLLRESSPPLKNKN